MKLIDIVVTQIVPALPEQVYDLWLDAKSPGGPWAGAECLIQNPVVDGLYYLAVQHAGRIWPHYGRFTRLERPRLIEYTWMSEGTGGNESLVTLTLTPRGSETEVTLHHSVPDDEMGRSHEQGWTQILSQCEIA